MRLTRQAFALLAPVVFAAFAPAALAQDKPVEGGKPSKPEKAVVRLIPKEGGWQIGELFDQINKTTGYSILYDSTNATFKQAKVEFTGVHVIAEDQLFDWLQAVLSYRKLVLVPVGPKSPNGKQQWFVMDQADPNLKSRPVYIEEDQIDDYADRDGLYVVTTLTLKNITDTTRVRNALSPLSTATAGIGRIQDIPGSRALIVGDFAPVVAAMKKLLWYIDKPNSRIDPHMEVVYLTNEVASELEPIITDLIQAADAGPQRQPRAQGAPDEEPEPKIIANNRLDALIIYATDDKMTKIKDLIVKLDVPTRKEGSLHYRVLKYTDAETIAKLVDDVINSGASSGSGTTSGSSRGGTGNTRNRNTANRPVNAGTQAGGGALQFSASEGAPMILADPKSNTLIVHASKNAWPEIEKLVDRLDQSRPQVLIETSLIELSLSDKLDLGVELFGSQKNIAVDTNGDGVPDAITEDAKSFGNTNFLGLATPVITDVGGVSVPTNKSPILGPGFTAGIFKNGKLPIILNAFQTAGRGRILTQPSIVTNDNEAAELTLEKKTSYQESVTNNSTTTSSFKEITATTNLSISPHISSDSYLRLGITQTVSNFIAGTGVSGAPPDVLTRKFQTNVTLPDTYTVVLGGLVQQEDRSSVSKVPILGDIPILGFFFRKTHDESTPTQLFLFVTPRIMKDMTNFTDFHKLTWEKKLLGDDLFHSEVVFPAQHFAGPGGDMSAREKLKRLEDSTELDPARLKAPPTDEELQKMAKDALHAPPPKADSPAGTPAGTPPK